MLALIITGAVCLVVGLGTGVFITLDAQHQMNETVPNP